MRPPEGNPEPVPPIVLRTIMRHLLKHGWTTRLELQQMAGISTRTFQSILENDLSLRRRQRHTPNRGRGPDKYNLPLRDASGNWILTEGRKAA